MATNYRHLHITVTATDYWLGCKVLIHMSQGGLHEGSTVHGTAFQHGWKLWRFVLVEEFNIRVIREAERHEVISVISPWYSHSIPTYRSFSQHIPIYRIFLSCPDLPTPAVDLSGTNSNRPDHILARANGIPDAASEIIKGNQIIGNPLRAATSPEHALRSASSFVA
jgi:hypothetical protein